MPSREEKHRLQEASNPIQGWASERELYALFDVAKACTGKGVIVEIGSWKGKSTVALGLGSQAGKQVSVFAIDPHTGSPDHLAKRPGEKIWTFKEFEQNIKASGLENIVQPILDTSEHVALSWDQQIALLYLDVNYHDYTLGKDDFLTWSKFVMDGGTIALHNTYPSLRVIVKEGQPFHGWPGPRKILQNFVFGKKGWKNIRIVDSTTLMEKSTQTSFVDALKGRKTQGHGALLLLARKLYGLVTLLPVPLKKLLKRIVVARREH